MSKPSLGAQANMMRERRSRGPLQVNTTTNEEAVFDGKETLAEHSMQLGLGIGFTCKAVGVHTTDPSDVYIMKTFTPAHG